MGQGVKSGVSGVKAIATLLVGPSRTRARLAAALPGRGFELAGIEHPGALGRLKLDRPPELVVLGCAGERAAFADAVASLRALNGHVPIVLVCPTIQHAGVRAALAAGVWGIVLEDELPAALAPCLAAVRTGQLCVPRRHARQIEPPVLSAREKQILGLVVMGLMNSEIAARLFLAESTVKSHLSSAFAKLGVRSRYEAANLILDPAAGLSLGILALHSGAASAQPCAPR